MHASNVIPMHSTGGQPEPGSLATRAVLASLSLKMWRGRRHDKATQSEVAESKHAAREAVSVTKRLMEDARINKVQNTLAQLRERFYRASLPWGATRRILPADKIATMQQDVNDTMATVRELINDLAPDWHMIVEEQRTRLGDLFDYSDFPASPRGLFAARFEFEPLAQDDSDFRLKMSDDQADLLRDHLAAQNRIALQDATASMWRRMAEPLNNLVTSLGRFDESRADAKRAPTVKESTVENVLDMLKTLRELNGLCGSDEAADMLDRIERHCTVAPAILRGSASARVTVRDEARAIAAEAERIAADMASGWA